MQSWPETSKSRAQPAHAIDPSGPVELRYWPYRQWGLSAQPSARGISAAARRTGPPTLIEPVYHSHSRDSYLIGAQHGTILARQVLAQCCAAAKRVVKHSIERGQISHSVERCTMRDDLGGLKGVATASERSLREPYQPPVDRATTAFFGFQAQNLLQARNGWLAR